MPKTKLRRLMRGKAARFTVTELRKVSQVWKNDAGKTSDEELRDRLLDGVKYAEDMMVIGALFGAENINGIEGKYYRRRVEK